MEPFPLTELPLELAEKIYFHALASGNTSVLRLSHSSNEAASRFRFEAGIFRIEIQEHEDPDHFLIRSHQMSTQVANLIQNVEIRIDLDLDHVRSNCKPSPGPIAQFMDPSFQRDTCYIVLRSHYLQRHYQKPWFSLSQIQRLRGFKTVIVRAICGDPPLFTGNPVRPTNPAFNRIREKLMVEMVRGDLEEAFGPGVMHKSDDGRRRLEFHPGEHQHITHLNLDTRRARRATSSILELKARFRELSHPTKRPRTKPRAKRDARSKEGPKAASGDHES